MTISLSPVNNLKLGTCPHGLPPGACPICSGAGGGGGGSAVRKADFSAKPGEMSWSDCAAMGQMLKNQKMAKALNEQPFQAQLNPAVNFQKNMENLALKINSFIQTQQATLPSALTKPIAFFANKLIIPVLNALKDIPLNIQKAAIKVIEKLTDISDKLVAMFGELKNSVEKKISDKLKDFKKKTASFFGVFEPKGTDDEDKKLEDEKRIFELKTVFKFMQKNQPRRKKK